jgi:histidinol dehydrogenase
MQLIHWQTLDSRAQQAALRRPVMVSSGEVTEQARRIIAEVRAEGDAAVSRLTQELEGVALPAARVDADEFAAAEAELTAADLRALDTAIANVRAFHAAQVMQPLTMEIQRGVRCERLLRPLNAVGLYVPAGSAPLPSTAVMLAVPAALAGCTVRVMCTPANPQGRANPAVLVAARRCGVHTVFKIGGAQAIAAMAYGTHTVPKVAKIFGPGNAWVTAAKQLVAADPDGAALDMPAGPSEVLVIADESARADFVAADLLAQAEHDANAQAVLVTTSAQLANQVQIEIAARLGSLSRRSILEQSLKSLLLIVVPSLDVAVAVSESYAPEHLLIETREPRALLSRITNAGSVFLGHWSPEPFGDYCSGTNHVLPTYGYARSYSGLSVIDFIRRMTVQELTSTGVRNLGPVAAHLARLEGLDAHALAVDVRLAAL